MIYYHQKNEKRKLTEAATLSACAGEAATCTAKNFKFAPQYQYTLFLKLLQFGSENCSSFSMGFCGTFLTVQALMDLHVFYFPATVNSVLFIVG